MIGLIDIGIGNVGSVGKVLNLLDQEFVLVTENSQLGLCSKIIFPGVGSYKSASEVLFKSGMAQSLRKAVLQDKKPILGICLGMQLLSSAGEEFGHSEGLNLIQGKTKLIELTKPETVLPHMGWNDVRINCPNIFSNIPDQACFYFVHSFKFDVTDEEATTSKTEYDGKEFCSAVEKGIVWGVQFHPEKSQKYGIQIFKNFCKMNAC